MWAGGSVGLVWCAYFEQCEKRETGNKIRNECRNTYISRYEMHTKNICRKGREWLIRLNNNNYTNKMKSYFLFPCIYLSVAASDTLLVPMKRQSYSSMNIHSPRLLNPDFLKSNLSFLLSIMYSELAFYL